MKYFISEEGKCCQCDATGAFLDWKNMYFPTVLGHIYISEGKIVTYKGEKYYKLKSDFDKDAGILKNSIYIGKLDELTEISEEKYKRLSILMQKIIDAQAEFNKKINAK